MKNQSSKLMLQSAKTQTGMLLIEVMIAVVIFSFGLLGLAGLQATATQNSTAADERIRASLLANDMVSMLWVRQKLNNPQIQNDIATWQAQVTNRSGLANAVGNVVIAANVATVTITWRSPSKKNGDSRYFTSIAMSN